LLIEEVNSNGRTELHRFKLVLLKLRVKRRDVENGRCPTPHGEYYNGVHFLLKSYDKHRWREQLIDVR
jgi:hypothetical protein